MIIFWDITKALKNKAHSGLNRVSSKLRETLVQQGYEVCLVRWAMRRACFVNIEINQPIAATANDVFITPELFCEKERSGIGRWLEQCDAKCVAIFHDAIPLKFPEFTWPKSVARHPFYMKELVAFDLVVPNSRYSAQEVVQYWDWVGMSDTPPVVPIPLGADFSGTPRVTDTTPGKPPLHMLMTGILEPRKNHEAVLGALDLLHEEGLPVQLSLVGRVNPHFGEEIIRQVNALIKKGLQIQYHRALPDTALARLYQQVDLTVFPSRAEGNGMPIIESLWQGKPTLASPIPPHLEHAEGGQGVVIVDPIDAPTLAAALRRLITDRDALLQLTKAAHEHTVPTWDQSAEALLQAIQEA